MFNHNKSSWSGRPGADSGQLLRVFKLFAVFYDCDWHIMLGRIRASLK